MNKSTKIAQGFSSIFIAYIFYETYLIDSETPAIKNNLAMNRTHLKNILTLDEVTIICEHLLKRTMCIDPYKM